MNWQPIETAPKDGTKFAAFLLVNGQPYVTVGYFSAWECEDGGVIGFNDETAEEWFEDQKYWPTHWMPLPTGDT
jgi:hypothetical protein